LCEQCIVAAHDGARLPVVKIETNRNICPFWRIQWSDRKVEIIQLRDLVGTVSLLEAVQIVGPVKTE